MSALAVTAASVLGSGNVVTRQGTAGATITAGQVLYRDSADSNKLKPADADGTSPINAPEGIALNGASNGQPVRYAYEDPSFTPGFTALAGDTIWLLETAGSMTKTIGDLNAGDKVSVIGVMLTTTTMHLKIVTGGAIA